MKKKRIQLFVLLLCILTSGLFILKQTGQSRTITSINEDTSNHILIKKHNAKLNNHPKKTKLLAKKKHDKLSTKKPFYNSKLAFNNHQRDYEFANDPLSQIIANQKRTQTGDEEETPFEGVIIRVSTGQ